MRLTRDGIYTLIIILLIAICGQFYYSYRYIPIHERDINVYYNKDIEANKELIKIIQDADRFVYFAIYTFTRSDIKDALLGAKHRGVDVRGIVDKEQIAKINDQAKNVRKMEDAGIIIHTQDHSAIMHLKTLVTEKAYVSGSYNWTSSATNSNDEILEIGRDDIIRARYENIIQKLLDKYKDTAVKNQ